MYQLGSFEVQYLFFSGINALGVRTSEVELALVERVDVGEGGVD
jgi:hypothetical protein